MDSINNPRLSGWCGPVIVDPKGEKAVLRRTRLRMEKTIILDPFRIDRDQPYTTSFNLLDHLKTDEESSK